MVPYFGALALATGSPLRASATSQKTADKKFGGALSDSSEPEGQELSYSTRISLDLQMQIEDKMVDLAPGMAVTVEIKTGTRRTIEYLMSAVLRYRQESLRER
jgi:hemolysin D